LSWESNLLVIDGLPICNLSSAIGDELAGDIWRLKGSAVRLAKWAKAS